MLYRLYREITKNNKLVLSLLVLTMLTVMAIFWAPGAEAQSTQNPQSGAIGLEGTIPQDPPSTGAVISFPVNGQNFTESLIEISGICPSGLLVKIFKNEVFAGSVECGTNGTFSLQVDLFTGQNTLVARVFDDLDQPGPDSNSPVIFYDDGNDVVGAIDRLALTSNFAKRGANPGSRLAWPFSLTGGTGPYAIVVDWGDGEESILSVEFPGEFVPEHVYEKPGSYRIVVKATDSNGRVAYLQVVGVANGAIISDTSNQSTEVVPTRIVTRFAIWPLYIMLFLIVSTFWLGKRYERRRIHQRMKHRLS